MVPALYLSCISMNKPILRPNLKFPKRKKLSSDKVSCCRKESKISQGDRFSQDTSM